MPLFMIRVCSEYISFYSHKFSDHLLNSVANGIEPMEQTQIQKFTTIDEDNQKKYAFSLMLAEDRLIIFQVLDYIQ